MKQLFFLLCFFIIGSLANAQDCKRVKVGKFKILADETVPESIITRTGKHQVEEMPSEGSKTKFDIVWTSDCTYTMKNPKVLKGKLSFFSDEHELYVKILKVADTFYTAEVTSNFADFVLVKDILYSK